MSSGLRLNIDPIKSSKSDDNLWSEYNSWVIVSPKCYQQCNTLSSKLSDSDDEYDDYELDTFLCKISWICLKLNNLFNFI